MSVAAFTRRLAMGMLLLLGIVSIVLVLLLDNGESGARPGGLSKNHYSTQSSRVEAIYDDRHGVPPEGIGDKETYGLCKHLGLTRLYHFTPSSNLDSILQHGILSRARLADRKIKHIATDNHRYDMHLDRISISIEVPNYRMLWKKILGNEMIGKNWVVLQIHPAVLWRSDCVYSQGNAASRDSVQQSGADGLGALYYPEETSQVPGKIAGTAAPKDMQSEVLVLSRISADYIVKVEFCEPQGYFDAREKMLKKLADANAGNMLKHEQTVDRLLGLHQFRNQSSSPYSADGLRQPVPHLDQDEYFDIPF